MDAAFVDQEDFCWACPTCTLLNLAASTCCSVCGWNVDEACRIPQYSCADDSTPLRNAVGQIWSKSTLETLLTLISNVIDHPEELKFRGPIRKGQKQILAVVVAVPGANEVLHLAGFEEFADHFSLKKPDLTRLHSVRDVLRSQLKVVSAKHIVAVKRKLPKFDENILREIDAEFRYKQGRSITPPSSTSASCAVAATSSDGLLRLRLRLPMGGRTELGVVDTLTLGELKELITQRFGLPPRHQRFLFGYPPRLVVARSDDQLISLGLRSGDTVYLENSHDMFLSDLEGGSYSMAELLHRVPSDEVGDDSVLVLFRGVLEAFDIDPGERGFWTIVRERMTLLAEVAPSERGQLKAGLRMLRRLFHNHHPRERLALAVDSLLATGTGWSTELLVDRAAFLSSVAPQVLSMSRDQLRSRVRVVYVGERGADAGGLTRDFFTQFANRLGDHEPLLWELTGRGSLQPTSSVIVAGACHLSGLQAFDLYRASGRIFGMAVLHGCKLGRPLSRSFVRLLVDDPPESLEELQLEVQYEAGLETIDFRAGNDILQRPLREFGLEGCLSFSCNVKGRPDLPLIELISGGLQIAVTDENKTLWLASLLRYELIESVRLAADAFQSGLVDALGGDSDSCPLLCLLAADDLIELWGRGGVCREDVSRWRAIARVSGVIEKQASWLWSVLEEDYDDELRGKVLQFATGSSSIGRDGLTRFRVEPADGSDDRLPTAMTCGQVLQLPRYSSRAILSARLRQAAEECSSFQMA